MKRKLPLCFLAVLLTVPLYAQVLIPSKNSMPVGAYYYPEHWDEQSWERDLKRMAELGFEFTHFGEFAWSMMEPEEGVFDFSWLDKAVTLADKYGLKVIMCTPTPTPPAWLTHTYPEVLIVNPEGRKLRHGTRLHVAQTHPVYKHFSERIIRKLGERYGDHPAVVGWQLDNEPHYRGLYDYSDHAVRRFRNWLRNKYPDIHELNRAWGNAFWSMNYNNFEQIRIPNKAETESVNPHALLDFQRFTARELAESLAFQEDVLREYVREDQWITTNYAYFRFLPSVNPFLLEDELDFASHTMYLLSTFLEYPEGELGFRLGSGLELGFSSEFARSVNGTTGIMELQPGQINWGQYNAQPLPGAVRMWIWHSFGLGDRFVCTYRFRQPLYGGEQYHHGIMQTDGVSLSDGGKEYVRAIRELEEIQKHLNPSGEPPESVMRSRTAFLWSFDNLFDMLNSPHTQSWDPWDHYYTWYAALKSVGARVDFITGEDDFDPTIYPNMVAPAYQLLDEKLVARWKEYVEKGGNLILTCRSGQKDHNAHLWEMKLQEPVYELIGGEILFNDQLPPGRTARVLRGETEYPWNVWAEVLKPYPGTEVLAVYGDEFYRGDPSALTRELGKGRVSYVGVHSEDRLLEKDLLKEIYTKRGVEIMDLPWYVFTEWREGVFVSVNYSSEDFELEVDNDRILMGEKVLKPGGVTVWKE